MDKINFIKTYIEKCEEIIDFAKMDMADIDLAEKFVDEIVVVFDHDILDIRTGLSTYNYSRVESEFSPIQDVFILKQKLYKYLVDIQTDIQQEKEKLSSELELARLNQLTSSANAKVNVNVNNQVQINIDFNQVIENVQQISEESLSTSDKETLEGYLYSLEGIKALNDKNKFWEKSKEVLKFLADKGADAAVAVLPYLIKGLTQ